MYFFQLATFALEQGSTSSAAFSTSCVDQDVEWLTKVVASGLLHNIAHFVLLARHV
jgi:hypothetical protein